MEKLEPNAASGGSESKIVVVGNEKGGSGKSTTAIHLAIAAQYRGYSVATLDLDPRQATMSRYLANRRRYRDAGHPIPLPRHLRLDEPADVAAADTAAERAIAGALDALAGHDIIVVDTPGSPSALSHAGHRRADILLTPVNDSLLDIDVLAEVDPANRRIVAPSFYCRAAWECANRRVISGDAPFDWIVIRNRLPHIHSQNRRDVDEILQKLARRIGFRLAAGLGERVIFRELFLRGLTVLDLPAVAGGRPVSATQRAARAEILELLEAVNIARRTEPAPLRQSA